MTSPAPAPPATPPYNRLGVDYRQVPPRKIPGLKIIDAHSHAHGVPLVKEFLACADAYNVETVWTMAPLADLDALNAAYPGRFRYIAIPKWQQEVTDVNVFVKEWIQSLESFYEKGARLIKFHVAPGSKKRFGLSLDHPLTRQVADHAYRLGYHFMSHVGDPRAWFNKGNRYESVADYDTFENQFPALDRFLERYPDRIHMGAHMGGSLEAMDLLQARLDKYPHYVIDSSATKWIVRAVAQQPTEQVRDFIIKNQDRILFGSDIVVGDKFNWDHYASRYWTHQMLWETNYVGESPIDDPDAPNQTPLLHGLDLPPDVLTKMYRANAERWLPKI